MGRSFADKLARRQLYSHVPEAEDGIALPDHLAAHFSRFDRAGWIRAVKAGAVTVNGMPARPDTALKRHDRVGYFPPESPEPDAELHFRAVYEDNDLLVIDKPAFSEYHLTSGLPVGSHGTIGYWQVFDGDVGHKLHDGLDDARSFGQMV